MFHCSKRGRFVQGLFITFQTLQLIYRGKVGFVDSHRKNSDPYPYSRYLSKC
jgi:hypothetical protein